MALDLNTIHWTTVRKKPNHLQPFDLNPRELTEFAADAITDSLRTFGLVVPLVINRDNKIIGGHQRWHLLRMNGAGDTEVEVRVPDRMLSFDECRELNIRLNANTGAWDTEALANVYDPVELAKWGLDMTQFGFGGPSNYDQDPDALVTVRLKIPRSELARVRGYLAGGSKKPEDLGQGLLDFMKGKTP